MDVVKLSGPLWGTTEWRRRIFYLQAFIFSTCEHIIIYTRKTYHRIMLTALNIDTAPLIMFGFL